MSKVTDLPKIRDPYARFVQSVRFMSSLEYTREQAQRVRDQALLELDAEGMSLAQLAEPLGVSTQRVHQILKAAREKADAVPSK